LVNNLFSSLFYPQELPEGSWYCQTCTCQNCGNPVSEKEVLSAHVKVEPELWLDSSTDPSMWIYPIQCTSLPNAPISASNPSFVVHVNEIQNK
jgi:hypothetical protein